MPAGLQNIAINVSAPLLRIMEFFHNDVELSTQNLNLLLKDFN